MALQSLEDLLLHDLKDLYNAENQMLKSLPRMAKKASSPELRRALEAHLKVTQGQVKRLEKVFDALDEKPKGKTCLGMKGLVEEAREIMSEDVEDDVLDAALIAAAQKAEHYEIAAYGTARTYAEMLGNEEAARLLQQTLDEEGEADKRLSALAERLVNVEAVEA
ncbi:MAG TPA: ferritin-like domain-containing protein [Vicinamibacterales bacterium]|nr:ferritin-like domain-containing protein [Vicinamibacterales bacterium]